MQLETRKELFALNTFPLIRLLLEKCVQGRKIAEAFCCEFYASNEFCVKEETLNFESFEFQTPSLTRHIFCLLFRAPKKTPIVLKINQCLRFIGLV